MSNIKAVDQNHTTSPPLDQGVGKNERLVTKNAEKGQPLKLDLDEFMNKFQCQKINL